MKKENNPANEAEVQDKGISKIKIRGVAVPRVDVIKFVILILIIAGFTAVIIYYLPFFMSLRDAQVRATWIDKIQNLGVYGALAMLLLQVLQVMLAAIPGEPVEIAAGFLFGTFGGLGICMIGICIGTALIFMLVRFLGASFVQNMIKPETMKKLGFLQNSRKLDTVVFLLFFIPGTPKDLLTYFIPLTPMKPLRFIILATFARIPSVLSSTLIGASLGEEKWVFSIAVFVGTALLGLLGIQINNWYMKKHDKAA